MAFAWLKHLVDGYTTEHLAYNDVWLFVHCFSADSQAILLCRLSNAMASAIPVLDDNQIASTWMLCGIPTVHVRVRFHECEFRLVRQFNAC